VIRGWCPTLYEPMETGDGLLVRVKPPDGRLGSDATRRLAASARAHGNGIIELTGRGNLQVRGLAPEGVAPFAAAMVEAGLASADAGAERRRNVLVSPLAGDDPDVAGETIAVATAVEAMLADDDLAGLPAKFCIAVDGGGLLPLAFGADVAVRMGQDPHPDPLPEGEGAESPLPSGEGWVRAGLCTIVLAGALKASCSCDEILPVLHRLAFGTGGRRMRDWLREDGAARVFGNVGVTPNPSAEPRSVEPVGFHQYSGTSHGAFGLGLPFGQTDAEALAALTAVAERFSDGFLRVSPWRALLLGSVRARDVRHLVTAVSALGLIADPRDPRLRVFACIGSPGCARGSVPARADAARLAATGFEGTLHVSGCAKGCAHPSPATVTMVGEAGRYRIVQNDRASAA